MNRDNYQDSDDLLKPSDLAVPRDDNYVYVEDLPLAEQKRFSSLGISRYKKKTPEESRSCAAMLTLSSLTAVGLAFAAYCAISAHASFGKNYAFCAFSGVGPALVTAVLVYLSLVPIRMRYPKAVSVSVLVYFCIYLMVTAISLICINWIF